MEQSESDERNDPTEGVVENEVGIAFSLFNLLILFVGDTYRRSIRKSFKWRAFTHNGGYGCFMFVILLYYKIVNNLEEKEKEIAMLKANEQVLNQQLQNSIEESNQVRIEWIQ